MDDHEQGAAIRFQEGDEAAFAELVMLHRERLYRMAYRLLGDVDDAMDATQEAFLKVYRSISRWDRRSSFYTWAWRMTYNLSIDKLRRRQRRREIGVEPEKLSSMPRAGPTNVERFEEEQERDYRLARLREAVDDLPEAQRVTMVLRHFEGRSLKEIAEIRECAVGTVKSTLHQAFRSLQDALERVA